MVVVLPAPFTPPPGSRRACSAPDFQRLLDGRSSQLFLQRLVQRIGIGQLLARDFWVRFWT
jgi:hypothetical protein